MPSPSSPTMGLPLQLSGLRGDRRATFLPSLERGMMCIGGPGSGKTFGLIDPLVRSGLHAGLPVILWDYKFPSLTAKHLPLAARLGYQVHLIAPGFAGTDVLNPLDFLEGPEDVSMAGQIVTVLHDNFKSSKSYGNDFFDRAGTMLSQAAMAYAKGTDYPDLMMVAELLSAPSLEHRIEAAKDMNPWVRAKFNQLVSLKSSPETASSVIGTSSGLFNQFQSPDILATFCGKTTVPLRLEDRQLVVLGMDTEREEVMRPLLAMALQLFILKNADYEREQGLLVVLDELSKLYIKQLPGWMNLHRQSGISYILAFQTLAQLDAAYTRHGRQQLMGAAATKVFFNPQDYESAQEIARYIGQHEIRVKQHTRTTGRQASRSSTEQRHVRDLITPAEVLQLKTGECIMINPHFGDKNGAYLPIRERARIPSRDSNLSRAAAALWHSDVRDRLINRATLTVPTEADILARRAAVEQLLGPPPPSDSERFKQAFSE